MFYLMAFKNTPNIGEFIYDPNNFHLTIMGEFNVSETVEEDLVKDFQRVIAGYRIMPISFLGLDYFGESFEIPVMTVEGGELLLNLHKDIFAVIEFLNGVVEYDKYSGSGYSPHISHLKDEADLWDLHSVSLVKHSGGFGVNVQNLANFYLDS